MMTSNRSGVTSSDEILSAVANEHRRVALRILNRSDTEVMSLDALTDLVLEEIRTVTPSDPDRRQRIEIELHHAHLPKLESCGLITYDAETKQIRNVTGELSTRLLAVLESHDDIE